MTNDIKEMLKGMLKYSDISQRQYNKLLDYITNLQEENKILRGNSDLVNLELIEINNELEEKIDKAVEYIKQHQVRISIAGEKELGFCDEFDIFSNPIVLLNILQGSDKDLNRAIDIINKFILQEDNHE